MSQNTELKAQAKKPGLNKKGIAAWINNYSFILIALAIFIAYLFINHGATTWSGVMNILRHSAVVGIMAFGMGLVIITGGIDLSVGSMLALVGSFSVVVFNATDSVFLTLLFALVAGGLCGLFNGVLIGLVKMPAFIVTLATMLIFRPVAQYYLRTTGSSIFNMTGTLDHYASFYGFGQLKIATVPVVASCCWWSRSSWCSYLPAPSSARPSMPWAAMNAPPPWPVSTSTVPVWRSMSSPAYSPA